jgi:hypothetical protein
MNRLMRVAWIGLASVLGACQSGAPSSSERPLGPQTVERYISNLETKDHIKVSFAAVMRWQYSAQPATEVATGEFPAPAAVEAVYIESLTEDLPKLIAEQEFPKLVAVHEQKPLVAKIEEKMLDKLRARALTATPGVAVEKFTIRRLDLSDATQRAGFDELERRRMREIWLAPQPGR